MPSTDFLLNVEGESVDVRSLMCHFQHDHILVDWPMSLQFAMGMSSPKAKSNLVLVSIGDSTATSSQVFFHICSP